MRDIANSLVRKTVSNIYPIRIESVRTDGQVKLNYGEPIVSHSAIYKVYDAEGFVSGKISIFDVKNKSSLGKILSGTVLEGMTCKIVDQSDTAAKTKVQEIPW